MTDRDREVKHTSFTYNGQELVLCKTEYQDGRLAVIVRDAMSFEPYAALSVAVYDDPEADLPDGEFWLKTYSENEEITGVLEQLGLIERTGREYQLRRGADRDRLSVHGR